jgi:hypothetical protein
MQVHALFIEFTRLLVQKSALKDDVERVCVYVTYF